MNFPRSIHLIIAASLSVVLANCAVAQEPPSEFDESLITTIQETSTTPTGWDTLAQEFENASTPSAKAAKYLEIIDSASDDILDDTWTPPAGGWKLFDFTTASPLTLEAVRRQQRDEVFYTKLIAQTEDYAVKLRGIGSMLSNAMIEGEDWAETLLLDTAQQSDDNLKRMTYWFAADFGQEIENPVRAIVWNDWQTAYNAANALGKAIILKNLTTLAIRREEYTTAANIHDAVFAGSDKELKAIALAYGHPNLGTDITDEWQSLADDPSDTDLQTLAQQALDEHGVTE